MILAFEVLLIYNNICIEMRPASSIGCGSSSGCKGHRVRHGKTRRLSGEQRLGVCLCDNGHEGILAHSRSQRLGGFCETAHPDLHICMSKLL